jgi:hypothetical protein
MYRPINENTQCLEIRDKHESGGHRFLIVSNARAQQGIALQARGIKTPARATT